MTLAPSGTTAFSGGFRLFRRCRWRRLCPFRFRLPSADARHFCRPLHADHFRARLYDTPHEFNLEMQREAWAFLDAHLGRPA